MAIANGRPEATPGADDEEVDLLVETLDDTLSELQDAAPRLANAIPGPHTDWRTVLADAALYSATQNAALHGRAAYGFAAALAPSAPRTGCYA